MSDVDWQMAALRDQLAAQRQAVGEIAVVRHREAAGGEFREQRLHVAQDGFAGRRIAHMAERGAALQPVDHLLGGEVIADEAEAALGLEALAVEGDDARRLLAAVLQRVQAERRQRRGVRVAVDAEHAALLAQPVGVQFEVEVDAHWLLPCPMAGCCAVARRPCPGSGCPAPGSRWSCSRSRAVRLGCGVRPAWSCRP